MGVHDGRNAHEEESDTIVSLGKPENTNMKTEVVTTLKRQATKLLADLHESKEPVLITEHGKPSAYLVDVADYEFMCKRMALLEAVARGEQAIQDGRTVSNSEAKLRMSKWLK